jgi:dephospho-CoA kinase
MRESKKLIIGLTGGIGSGKSEVSRRFESLGIKVIDADLAARIVVEPGQPALTAIANHFGESILHSDLSLNRSKLRAIIFSDPAQKKWLENLLHPIIRTETILQLQASTSPYTILSSPLLLETDQHQLVDRILVVDATETMQIARATARDGNSQEEIERIMATQLSRPERLKRADDVIHNHNDLRELQSQIEQLHRNYLHLAKEDR